MELPRWKQRENNTANYAQEQAIATTQALFHNFIIFETY